MEEWKAVWQFVKKLQAELALTAAIPFLGVCSKERKNSIQLKPCTYMSTAATFTIAKRWRQLKRLSTNEKIKKVHTMEYYSTIKMVYHICYNTNGPLKTLCSVKKSHHRSHLLYDPTVRNYLERVNAYRWKADCHCWGLGKSQQWGETIE